MFRNLVVLTCALGVCGIAARSISRAADEPTPAAKAGAKPAEPTDAKDRDKPQGDEVKPPAMLAIEKALEQPCSFDYVDTPLKDAVDHIKLRCGIEIQLDHRALAEVSIPEDKPISVEIKGIPLRSGAALHAGGRRFGLHHRSRHCADYYSGQSQDYHHYARVRNS